MLVKDCNYLLSSALSLDYLEYPDRKLLHPTRKIFMDRESQIPSDWRPAVWIVLIQFLISIQFIYHCAKSVLGERGNYMN
jgi:hypothetical protein